MFTELAVRALLGIQEMLDRSRDDDGQTLAEYSILITVIAVAVVILALVAFRGALAGAFNAATSCLDGDCSS